MRKLAPAMAAVCILGMANGGPFPGRAATIDTFDFTQVGWIEVASFLGGTVSGSVPDPGGILSGSFTGTVEPSGLIELGDLTSFSDTYFDLANPGGIGLNSLFNLSLFSYNTTGGASSLDIAGSFGQLFAACVGAAVPLDGFCTSNFQLFYPPGTNGAIVVLARSPVEFTSNRPVITLVSSVTTPPAVPEPSTVSMLMTFLAGWLGVAGWTARRRHAAADAARAPGRMMR